jgi:uncharacterized protein YbgA (DUF1722 family)/uncharacterized protein YbbK (DUF523 family)
MKIGVSACLLGEKVRYDGTHKKDSFIVEQLVNYFELIGYCPEAPVFGTPRPTIRLSNKNNKVAVEVGNTGEIVTHLLEDSSKKLANEALNDDLCGFIFKSKSPSCGMERVKIYQPNNHPAEHNGIGVFADQIKKRYPNLPMEEEGRLNDPWLKENFLMQVFAYGDLQKLIKTKPEFKDLVAFHTSYKYLIFAKSEKAYKSLGKIVANHDKLPKSIVLEQYKNEFFKAINEKSTIKKTYNVLLHIIGYFKKFIKKEEKQHLLNACDEYKESIIPLIAVTKLINLYVTKFNQEYLKEQKFLNPYPKEFSLRSDIKAYK